VYLRLQHVPYSLEDEKCDEAISDEPPSVAQSQEEEDDRCFDDAQYRIVKHLLCHVELGGIDLVVHGPHMGGNVPDVVAKEICLYTLLLLLLLIRIVVERFLYLNPVVDNSSIRHREHTCDHAKSIVCLGWHE
jgi:hypothetical protein